MESGSGAGLEVFSDLRAGMVVSCSSGVCRATDAVLPGFQKRRRKLRDSRRTEDGHVRRVRDDREAAWRSQRSIEAGVALSAAQQFVELHDVFRANRVGIRKHEQS